MYAGQQLGIEKSSIALKYALPRSKEAFDAVVLKIEVLKQLTEAMPSETEASHHFSRYIVHQVKTQGSSTSPEQKDYYSDVNGSRYSR